MLRVLAITLVLRTVSVYFCLAVGEDAAWGGGSPTSWRSQYGTFHVEGGCGCQPQVEVSGAGQAQGEDSESVPEDYR